MCRQTIRSAATAAGTPALSCRHLPFRKRPVLTTILLGCNGGAYRVPSYMGGSPVASKHFKNPARREWWSVHIEAWQRSGLSQRRYCRIHRLTDTTFTRWLRTITDAEAAKIRAQNPKILAETQHDERRRQRRGRPFKLTANRRNQAAQAFVAMHVETLN